MITINLPKTDDTREILSAYENWLLTLGQAHYVPSLLPIESLEHVPLSEKTLAFSIVLINNVTVAQAKDIQFSVGSASPNKSRWGGPSSYKWPTNCLSPTIQLVQQPGEEGYTLAFSMMYVPESDLKLILDHASNKSHLSHYKTFGIDTKDVHMYTFAFREEQEWQLVTDLPGSISEN